MKQVVDQLQARTTGSARESARSQLVMAGYRGQQAEVAFLFFRLVMPIA